MTGEQQPPSQPQRIDPYVGQYAARADGMVASEIRALFAVAARPEIVSLAGGSPYITALPLDAVGEMAGQLVADQGAVALQYCTAQGDAGLRERICDVMALEGIRAHPDEVVVTVGSQQALDLITRIFVDPGDVVLAEAPSYVGALGTFASYQANVVHVPMDDDGLIPEALAETIRRWPRRAAGEVPLHGAELPQPGRGDARRRAAAPGTGDLPARGPAGGRGQPLRPARLRRGAAAGAARRRRDGVVYLGTFSKTSRAGVRVGWALAPPAIRDKLVLAAESAVLCHSSFAQLMVREYLTTQPWREQIKIFRELYRERRDAMLERAGRRSCRPAAGGPGRAAGSTSGCGCPTA